MAEGATFSGWDRWVSTPPTDGSDSFQAQLKITVPDNVSDGNYHLGVANIVDGKELVAVSLMLAVGAYPIMATQNKRNPCIRLRLGSKNQQTQKKLTETSNWP